MTACAVAEGYINKNGYRYRRYLGKVQSAHRARFHEVFGWWPDTVRHTCDNRACGNPLHLLPGTQSDNMRDAWDRGRRRRSPNHGMPDQYQDKTAYNRERRRRIEAGIWVGRA